MKLRSWKKKTSSLSWHEDTGVKPLVKLAHQANSCYSSLCDIVVKWGGKYISKPQKKRNSPRVTLK